MRKNVGRINSLMIGSAIALALAAAPLAIDWKHFNLCLNTAIAKDDGGGKGGGGGGKGGKGKGGEGDKGKGDKGKGGKGKDGKGDKGEQGGGGQPGGDTSSGSGQSGSSGQTGDSNEAGTNSMGSGNGKSKAADPGNGASGTSAADDPVAASADESDGDGTASTDDSVKNDDGDTEAASADAEDAADSTATSDSTRDQTRIATARTVVDESPPSLPMIMRAAGQTMTRPLPGVTVRIRMVRKQPPQDSAGPEDRARAGSGVPKTAAAPLPAPAGDDMARALAGCIASTSESDNCTPVEAQLAPAAGPASAATPAPQTSLDPAGPTPPAPDPQPAELQLAYAVPRIEPDPLPDIDENIYALMQVEATRYIDTTIPILVVQGLVTNMSRTKRPVPSLVAIVTDDGGRQLARWKFIAEAPTLAPGASTGFRSETVDPAPQSTKVTVIFAAEEEQQPQVADHAVPILAAPQ